MMRAARAGHFHAPMSDTVVLDHEERRRRRGVAKTVGGLEFLIDLAEAPELRGGDAYVLEDGRLIEIVAAPEELLEVRATDPLHLTRIAYHLGNRHLECEISAKRIRIRRDHVIADMLKGLGAKVAEIEAPFHPEGGAYLHHGGHAHDHGRGHDGHGHVHAHGHAHDHRYDHADHGHEHGHGHGHGH
jgi:urease accessory protein